MKILPQWLREFVDIPVDDSTLARDLTQAGINIEGVAAEQGQTVFEAEITTNRPDAMNHYGVARECAAVYDVELKPLSTAIGHEPSAVNGAPAKGQRPMANGQHQTADGRRPRASIEIHDAAGCARYTARVIRGIRLGASPDAIRHRLELLGSKSISNVVDASNYTLQEMGHPTHAFDLDKLAGGGIIVRRARPGERVRTLDGVERVLESEDVVIADAEKPVALAGIMGGFDSMITPGTRNVLIESAWFDPIPIRKTARRLGMHTDASHRFERGADWGATSLGCARVTRLILETAGGELEGDEIDVVSRRVGSPPITLRLSEIVRILGETFPSSAVAILSRLGFGVAAGAGSLNSSRWTQKSPTDNPPAKGQPGPPARADFARGGVERPTAKGAIDNQTAYVVEVPTWRLDVEKEIDLIEELARIYGYNKFPDTLPAFAGSVVELPNASSDTATRASLLALGYDEAISLSFVSAEAAREFSIFEPAMLANPVSDEAPAMRTSLVPGMLAMLERNLNRGNPAVRLFEMGHVFEMVGDRSEEHAMVCMGATGNTMPLSVHQHPRQYGFFDLKGDIETLLDRFEHRRVYFDSLVPQPHSRWLRSGRSARFVMDGSALGYFGEVRPDTLPFKLRQPVFVAELNLERLYRNGIRKIDFNEPSRYPAVDRDFSFIFPDEVTFERISGAMEALHVQELRSFMPVEIFRGGAIPPGSYSLLLRAMFQSNEHTLRDQEIAAWSERIIAALKKLGGTLRSS